MADRPEPPLQEVDAKRARLAELLAAEARRPRRCPQSYAQQRLWFLDQLVPGSAAYNVVQGYRLEGELHLQALRRSLVAVVERQASLRTTFADADGVGIQVVAAEGGDPLRVVDLEAARSEETEREVRRLAELEASSPFDLRQGPLFRATLYRLGPRDHLLLLVMHHIVSDGWSLGVLWRELRQLYAAHRNERPPSLPTLPIQYADFAAWQRAQLGEERLRVQLDFWRRRLAGAAPLDLATDRPRPAVHSFRGRRLALRLGRDLREATRSFARREGLTPFMTLLAAFQALLRRYSGQDDVVVGTPIAGRTRAEVEGLVGFFVNTLVLRTDLSGDPTFAELAQRVRQASLEAFAHPDVPFERLVDELAPERSLDRNPVFQVVFALQNAPAEPLQLEGLRASPFEVERLTSKLDLVLSLEERGPGLEGFIEYASDLFDAPTIERMGAHYETLLRSALAQPELPLSRLRLLGEGERARLLRGWNATRAEYPQTAIGSVFGEVARARPQATAVSCGGERLTYAELDALSNRLARHLRAHGVGLESRVGVCLERTPMLIVGLLAILKAGGAYLALDPEYPPERLEFLAGDAGVSVILTEESLAARVASCGAGTVLLDRERGRVLQQSAEPLDEEAGPDTLAYVAYTSGSTGIPKGVEVRHRGVLRLVYGDCAELGPAETFLQLAPVSFDASTLEIWAPLLRGGRCALFPGRVPSPLELGEALEREGVTSLWLTASLFNAVVDERPEALSGLKQLLIGGEALSVAHVKKAYQRLPATRIINGYGPTEGTTFTCCHPIPRDLAEATSIAIGRPIANTRAYVLDDALQPVPLGVPGELFVGGDGLARGYLNRPALTAEVFVPDPFGQEPGGRLYRTGDRVRYRQDGRIEFLGRRDQQVKVRGYRIEPGEIEAALRRAHPSVQEAAVVVRQQPDGQKRLQAFLVGGQPGSRPSGAELRGLLGSSLPEYMVPHGYAWLDALPLTPNGKADREALARLEVAVAAEETNAFTAPRTPVEARLTELWAQVLGIPRVGIHDNFFELGGDSILSIQLTARAGKLGLRIRPRDLFQHQTVAELARVVPAVDAPPVEPVAASAPVPLTPIQRWFFDLRLPEPRHFSQAVLLDVPSPLDAARLERALATVGAQHDALRLRFDGEGSARRQRIGPPEQPPRLRRIEMEAVAHDARSAAVGAVAAELSSTLDLERGPLWAVAILHWGDDSVQLLWVVHHLAVDGVSWRILVEDLDSAYRQLLDPETVSLPLRTTPFTTWAERLGRHAPGASEAEADYWLRELAQPTRPLPVDDPGGRGANDFGAASKVAVQLGEEETESLLRDVPRAYGTRTHETLLAALAQALGPWTRAGDCLIDVEAHGREEVVDGVDLSRTVGWFTVVHPLRLPLEGVDSPRRALVRVKEKMRGVPNRGLGYGLLRYLGKDARLAERLAAPGAELSFNYLGQFEQLPVDQGRFRLAGGEEAIRFTGHGRRPHLLGLSGRVLGRRLRLEWSFCESLHRRTTVERLAQAHLEALRALVAHCQAPGAGGYTPSDFPLAALEQSALDRLVAGERDIEAIYPLSPTQQGLLFHARFAPESVAYHTQIQQTVQGTLDVAALRSAWTETMERHAVLRTCFAWEGLDEPLQLVRRRLAVPFEEHDWRSLADSERANRLQTLLRADRQRRFDLARAPVWRVSACRGPGDTFDHVLSFHHTILDGWSLAVLLQEVFSLYEAKRDGSSPRLPPARPFQDYVGWLRRRDAGDEQFWREELQGFAAPTALRLLAPPAAGPDERYEERGRQVSPQLAAALQDLARRSHLTLGTLLQGAWALLLGRYGGADDVAFGLTLSGRPPELEGVESAVGLFVNTLPVRVRLPARERVGEWLERLQERQAELRRHEWSSLADVQRWSEVPEGAPLFESLLLYENYPAIESLWHREGSLRVVDVRGYQDSGYPLTVVVVPRGGLWIRIKYDARRFTGATVDGMLAHLEQVLRTFAARPQGRLADVSLAGEEERRHVLVDWNRTASAYPRNRGLDRLFRDQAQRTPDRPALGFGGERLSYRELDARANRVARSLRRRGVGLESRVGLCVERSAAMVVGMLAILKAGGAYVPLDPALPRERLAYMARDAGVRVVLTQESLRTLVPAGRTALSLDGDLRALDEDDSDLGLDTPADALAYVIYTSGSTGEPKGVGVPHRAVARLVLGTDYLTLGPGDVVAQVSSPSFDATTFEVWGPLLNGAQVAGITREVTLSPPAFAEELGEQGVTTLFLTTALFNQLAREAPQALAGRTVLFGGEAVDPQWVRRALECAAPRRLLHVYGPTETTTFATWHQVTEVAASADNVPIGKAIANTTRYVLDPDLNPVPPAVAGELYLGGDGVARGYLERPALTAERFLPDPFGSAPGGRLYRTGDLVRARPDGALEFLGRVDHQVKLRGFRIELGEIEALLARHPAVRVAVVVVREDEPGDRRLVAYLEWATATGVAAGELRAWLGSQLPEYMIPAAFVAVDAIPLNRNGKVDRGALPAPEGRRLELAEEVVPPRTPVEEILAGIYAQVLGVERVSAGDSFFDLGGHSLKATQVVSRVREALQAELPLRALFEAPTVAELAVRVEEERRRGLGERAAPELTVRPDEAGSPPLSFAQQRLWFLDQLEPGGAAYNVPLVLRLSGPLDAEALDRAYQEIQRRHAVLRTSFASDGGAPVQRVARSGVPLERSDLRGRDTAAGDEMVAGEVATPFDLARGPLVRGRLLRLTDSQHLLVVVTHHAVSDGWSIGVFARELEALYAAFRAGQPSPLPGLALQYGDFAGWQRDWLSGEALSSQLDYWRRVLAGCSEGVTFPCDHPRPTRPAARGQRRSLPLSPGLSDDIRAFSRREGVTLFMTLLAALDVLLSRHSGQSDIQVGTPIAGRTHAELEPLVGFFVNTLVLRTELSGNPSFRELLARVRETALGAYAHQDLPFEKLVAELQPQRDPGRTPLFQVMFNLVNLETRPPRLEGLEVEALPNPEPESKFDLTLYALDGPGEIRLVALYNPDLYDARRMAEILGQLELVLAQAVSSPEAPIDRLSLVTPSARRFLPDPAQPLAAAPQQPITARLHQQAQRVPRRPALLGGRHTWSYAELDEASSRLAGRLQALGVARGDTVAIHGQRTTAFVAALLGVMKAGGAFLILDPAYPAPRTIDCIRQAEPGALLDFEGATALPAAVDACFSGARVRLPEDPAGGPWTDGPAVDLGPGDGRAYVAFTSGTTGVPKGIVGTQAPLSHFLDWHTRHFGLEERDRFSLLSGLAHDPMLRDVLTPLWLGATLAVPPPDVLSSGRLGEWMAEQEVTVAHLTPAVARLLAEGRRPVTLPSLRYVFFGGDVVTGADVARLRALASGARCVSYYGATETPQGMGVFVVPEGVDLDERRPLPLGKGIADARLLVLGAGGGLAGIGEIGEVHVQTPYLTDGYLADEARTRERFVPDPFAAAGQGRLYRTGDLGRYGLSGDVEPAGRADDQVKVRGFRIEPAEVEAILREHPGISEAAVIAAEDRPGERRLVAHVVARNAEVPSPESLRTFVSGRLPEYMVPSFYRVLRSLPLTPNGKIDRRALADRGGDVPEEGRTPLAPRTPVEELLCGIWAGLLGVERVGVQDDFFSLGGHSLLATQAVSRLRDALGIELPLRRLFEAPRIADLAPVVTQALLDADPEAAEELFAGTDEAPAAAPDDAGPASLDALEGE